MSEPSASPEATSDAAPSATRLSRSVWALGLVSLFQDVSSELVHCLLPLFMVDVLGVGALAVGLLEGVALAIPNLVKIVSGAMSDRSGRRKPLLVAGYGLSALTKPLFPLAQGLTAVATARFLDRVGKGVRGAPRDALVADVTPTHLRGRAYGLRQALDSTGAVIGPLGALLLMSVFDDDVRHVLWFGTAPAALAMLTLVFGVREPARARASGAGVAASVSAKRPLLAWRDVVALPPRAKRIVALGAVFTLARFSEAFLVLRADDTGLAAGLVPLVFLVMNAVDGALSYPFGALADRVAPRGLLIFGLLALIAADVLLALATGPVATLVGVGLWGLHLAATQGLFGKLVSESIDPARRGTAFGVFGLVTGLALLVASSLAGLLWTEWGPSATFTAGAVFAGLAALGLAVASPARGEPAPAD
ncbi:MAG: MFS transporter [Planctomycetes bacterium]|nr:MFS transporter [Planctomycetota bacterium]